MKITVPIAPVKFSTMIVRRERPEIDADERLPGEDQV